MSSTVSSEDSSQFSVISNSIEKIEETIKRDESIKDNLNILDLQQRCVELERHLEDERNGKAGLYLEIRTLEEAKERLQSDLARTTAEAETVQKSEVERLQSELATRTQTIQLLVSEKSELQALSEELARQKDSLEQREVSLELSVEQLDSACSELRQQVAATNTEADNKQRVERETETLRSALQLKEQSYSELQNKLSQVQGDVQ